mgnify:CR=1 FL=1
MVGENEFPVDVPEALMLWIRRCEGGLDPAASADIDPYQAVDLAQHCRDGSALCTLLRLYLPPTLLAPLRALQQQQDDVVGDTVWLWHARWRCCLAVLCHAPVGMPLPAFHIEDAVQGPEPDLEGAGTDAMEEHLPLLHFLAQLFCTLTRRSPMRGAEWEEGDEDLVNIGGAGEGDSESDEEDEGGHWGWPSWWGSPGDNVDTLSQDSDGWGDAGCAEDPHPSFGPLPTADSEESECWEDGEEDALFSLGEDNSSSSLGVTQTSAVSPLRPCESVEDAVTISAPSNQPHHSDSSSTSMASPPAPQSPVEVGITGSTQVLWSTTLLPLLAGFLCSPLPMCIFAGMGIGLI